MIRLSIARPVTIAMAYFVIAALGVFAWRNIPARHHWPAAAAAALSPLRDAEAWPGARRITADASFRARIERLDLERFILFGAGDSDDPDSARARRAALIRTTPRAPLRSLASAAITAAGPITIDAGAIVQGEVALAAASACPTGFADPDTALAPAPAVITADAASVIIDPAATILGGIVGHAAASGDPTAQLNALLHGVLADIADRSATGTIIPLASTTEGKCDLGLASNWGQPDNPLHPCHNYAPLVHAPGDLVIAGGAAQGILVVGGALTLDAGARFHGLILAVGPVLVRSGAVVLGALRSAATTPGAVRVHGTVRFNRCAIVHSLAHSPALSRPIRTSSRSRIPAW